MEKMETDAFDVQAGLFRYVAAVHQGCATEMGKGTYGWGGPGWFVDVAGPPVGLA